MTEQQLQARTGSMRVLLGLVLAVIAAVVVWVALSALWHFPQPVYRLTFTRMAFTLGASAAALLGLKALWRAAHPGLALATLLVACLWVVSFVSFIGVVTLPMAALLTLLLAAMSRRAGGGAGEAAPPAFLVAVALAVLLFASPWIAAVDCGSGGVTTTSGRPFDSDSMSSSGSGVSTAVPDSGHGPAVQESRGRLGFDDETYVYRCRGGELVEFRRVS